MKRSKKTMKGGKKAMKWWETVKNTEGILSYTEKYPLSIFNKTPYPTVPTTF